MKYAKAIVLFAGVISFLLCAKNWLRSNEPYIFYPSAGVASWYTTAYTATGEWFDDNEPTCAMRRSDFGKYYRVCNQDNNKCVIVRHNNFGPERDLYLQGRIIDLSKSAFTQLEDLNTGIIKVTVTEVDPAAAGSHE